MTGRRDRDVDIQLQLVRDAAIDAEAVGGVAVQVIAELVPKQERDDEADDDGPHAAPRCPFTVGRVRLRVKSGL